MSILTDRPELAAPPAGGDFIHLVDVSDATDNPAGSSVKQAVDTFLRGRAFGKNTNVTNIPASTIIFNMSNTANHPGTQGLVGDFVLYMDITVDSLILGVAIATVVTFPADLNDSTKFVKFLDATKLLP